MSLNDTPRANRLHIGIYGKRNAGKSSLINALTGQDIALVSSEAGTTTDPVFKAMELHPIGPVVFIDTAGFDDVGSLGKLRVERTEAVINKTDVAIVVAEMPEISGKGNCTDDRGEFERRWIERLEEKGIPVIIAVNKMDAFEGRKLPQEDAAVQQVEQEDAAVQQGEQEDAAVQQGEQEDAAVQQFARAFGEFRGKHPIIAVSAAEGTGLEELRKAIEKAIPETYNEDRLREQILGELIGEGELALLVMPQDIQAPKGRLILPQVQTIRELLDRKCITTVTTEDDFERALGLLNKAPDLIITDSQCFDKVYSAKPMQSALTSFSMLFAAYKGDMEEFLKGASLLGEMTENSRVLIAEACSHVPLNEDIGRVKIPALLRKNFGEDIKINNVCGNDFPAIEELKNYDLIIHCGACMFNRKHVQSRIQAAKEAGVPITNYGVALAKLAGILEKISIPG